MFKTFILIASVISFITIIGAAVYEHLAVVPRWAAAPPQSLSMFQGKYGLNPGVFWQLIHPVTLLLMILSLVFYWKTGLHIYLLITLVGYVIVVAATFLYFVPELLSITKTNFEQAVIPDLQKRAARWERLSILRLICLVALAGNMLYGLIKLKI